MKRATKTVSILGALIVVTIYIWQIYTPTSFGTSSFPLVEKWWQKLDNTILDISTSDNDMILIKTTSSLIAFNQDSGDLIWNAKLGSQVSSYPAIEADNRLFVTDKKQLWAFDVKSGKILWSQALEDTSSWVTDASENIVLVNLVSKSIDAYDAKTGKKLWTNEAGRGHIRAYIDNDSVYVIDHGIVAYNAHHGNQIWRRDRNATGESAFKDGIIYFSEYNENNIKITAFDVNKKHEIWNSSYQDEGIQKLYIYDKYLIMTDNNAIYRINLESGVTDWKLKLSSPGNSSYLDRDIYTLERFTRIIHAVNIGTGNDSGTIMLSFPRFIDSDNQIMISTSKYLFFSRYKEVFAYGK